MSSPPIVAPGPISTPSPPAPLSPGSDAPKRSNSNRVFLALGMGIGIGGGIVLVCLCLGIFMFSYRRKRRHTVPPASTDDAEKAPKEADKDHPGWPNPRPSSTDVSTQFFGSSRSSSSKPIKSSSSSSSMETSLSFSRNIFIYEELALATNNFCSTNLLGQGGFGYVHKGVLSGGRVVAVKQLKHGSGQGEREFRAEVETISRVHHRHLVSLIGHCISGERRLLVYEYVPNRTLEFHLHGKGSSPINWSTRMKIAVGSAKGLAYLHEECHPKIIHRDIKSSNILLDENFEPKVADFGLARFYSDTDTHVSTRVMGTFGYLAPEYALTGKLTDKSDVFSFGVVLLELITGRRPIDKSESYLDDNIIDWARPLLAQALETKNFDYIADPLLREDYDAKEMARMVACAHVSVQHLARLRPRISRIILTLEGNTPIDELKEEVQLEQTPISEYDSSYNNTIQYKEDLVKFRKMALNTGSCYSGPTSEFFKAPSCCSSETAPAKH